MDNNSSPKRLPLVENDPWLEPVEQAVFERYERFQNKLDSIENQHGSLIEFADAHHYYGFTYDKKRQGWYYREWAPAAYQLNLIGDFNNWDRNSHPLQRNAKGDWEIFLPKSEYQNKLIHGSKIKTLVDAPNGVNERIPAFIRYVEQDDNTKNFSGVFWWPSKSFSWKDDSFETSSVSELIIYEAHTGMATEEYGVGSYREFADNVLPYVKESGYTAVQMMAIAEHPYYGSFGYHVSNFFAPSSRFGTPDDLKYLVKKAHSLGLAFIMDIVHSHTVKNTHEGLNDFDGSGCQYTHAAPRGDHPAWDSKLFDYGKLEVQRFLLSNVRYWMEEYHVDGYRFDGVTSMLYFHHGLGVDFGSREGYFTDGVEFDAVVYLQLANTLIKKINPSAISIAEDVSGMPGLTESPFIGGIGFDYRLAMGIPDYWIKQLKEVRDENWSAKGIWNVMLNRKFQDKTISYAESHDQALVGDKTIAFRLMDQEMYWNMNKGSQSLVIDRGISLHKLMRFVTISLGGNAYLNFMGNEFGHPEWIDFPRLGNNWSYHYARRQWSLATNNDLRYKDLGNWDKAMLQLIKRYKTLNADFPRELWDDEWHKTIAFERSNLVFVFNWHLTLSPFQFEFIVPKEGEYKLILNSDDTAFGGFGRIDPEVRYHTKLDADGFPRIAIYNVNRTAMVFVHIDDEIPVPEAEILKAESQPTVQAPTKAKKTTSKPKATKKAKE